ncbi:MAG: DUF1501 domain-containing protein [Verrucomicrobiales bacterium]|nr:DUF1501 domain-containing protein [Verrucomicrobiales bacterium]
MNIHGIATRRDFLTRGLGLVGIGSVLPNFLVHTALAGPQAKGGGHRILVLIEMSGGNDGPSALVPYAMDNYHRLRKATRINEQQVIRLNDEVGLNPNLRPFKELLDQGKFAAVPGVGYPNPNYSHEQAMFIWHTGDPTKRLDVNDPGGGTGGSGRSEGVGWVGRYADAAFKDKGDIQPTIAVGSTGSRFWAMQARDRQCLNIDNPEAFGFRYGQSDPLYRSINAEEAARSSSIDDLEYITRTVMQANATSQSVMEAAKQAKENTANYPNTGLGRSLRTVGALIGGGLSARVYFVRQGGYDTHAGQRAHHDNLLTDLSGSIAAFHRDMTRQGNADRALVMTFSEFGRTVAENNSQGTDHGSATPMFLVGNGVKAGVHGNHPSYEHFNPQGHFIPTHDFRSVYASVLEKWLDVPAEPILGGKFAPLDCIA